MRIFDPVAGGEALLWSTWAMVKALEVFKDPATGEPRLACAGEKVFVFDPVAGGAALVVIDVGDEVKLWLSSRTRRRARRGLLVVVGD